MKKIAIDTNILLRFPEVVAQEGALVVLPVQVLEELDNQKSRDGEIAYKARVALRTIEKYADKIEFDLTGSYEDMPESWDARKNDNKIVMCAFKNKAELVTNDLNCKIKAESLGVKTSKYFGETKKEVKGWTKIKLKHEEWAKIYENLKDRWNIAENEYLIIEDVDTGEIVDRFKKVSGKLERFKYETMKSLMFGAVKPRDYYQQCAFNSLLFDQFSMLTGPAGSGKSYLALAYCFWAVDHGVYDKIVIMSNPVKARGTADMGFYTGDRTEKLLQNSLGSMLTGKFHDSIIIHKLISENKLMLVSAADCRGMEISDNEILYVPEAQNLSIDTAKLIIQRAGKKSKIIFDGDDMAQVDSYAFEGDKNGLRRAAKVFSGTDVFSHVYLPNIYRSKMAEIAEKM